MQAISIVDKQGNALAFTIDGNRDRDETMTADCSPVYIFTDGTFAQQNCGGGAYLVRGEETVTFSWPYSELIDNQGRIHAMDNNTAEGRAIRDALGEAYQRFSGAEIILWSDSAQVLNRLEAASEGRSSICECSEEFEMNGRGRCTGCGMKWYRRAKTGEIVASTFAIQAQVSAIIELIKVQGMVVHFRKVMGHSISLGNNVADGLARRGRCLDSGMEIGFEVEEEEISM